MCLVSQGAWDNAPSVLKAFSAQAKDKLCQTLLRRNLWLLLWPRCKRSCSLVHYQHRSTLGCSEVQEG